jgi:hypothetical protein
MIHTYATAIRDLQNRVRRLHLWCILHPRLTAALIVTVGYLIACIALAPPAHAADGTETAQFPLLPPTPITDSAGVSLTHYITLPLDRGQGQFGRWDKGVVGFAIDFAWIPSVVVISWVLWLFQWLLGFEWVSWLATPLNSIATLLQTFLGELNWIPFALMVTALAAGIMLMRGRYATGGAEIAVSVVCAVLAGGLLVNPVATITGPGGALEVSQTYGANLAASIVSDDDQIGQTAVRPADAQNVITTAITGQLVDLFVRQGAQIVVFGKPLTGDCEAVFTDTMSLAKPYDLDSTEVRDKVGDCDPAAKDHVQHPGVHQVITAGSMSMGTLSLLILGIGLALFLFAAILYTLWQAMKSMVAVQVAVLPALGRAALWKSVFGTYIGAFTLAATVVALAVYLRLLIYLLSFDAGLNLASQMMIVNLFNTVFLVSLIVARHRAKKAGETLAERLSKIGLGNAKLSAGPSPILSSAMRVGEHYVASALRNSRKPTADRQLAPTAPRAKQPAPTADAGYMHATRDNTGPAALEAGSPSNAPAGGSGARPAGGRTGSKMLGAALAATELATAAATGGTSSVVLRATTLAGQTVLQRHIAQRSTVQEPAGRQPADIIGDAPASQPFGRRIIVDADGHGHIERQAERNEVIHDISSLPPRRPAPARPSPLRNELARIVGPSGS